VSQLKSATSVVPSGNAVTVAEVVAVLESIGVLFCLNPNDEWEVRRYRIINRITEGLVWIPNNDKCRAIGRRIRRAEMYEEFSVATISPALFPAIVMELRTVDPTLQLFKNALTFNIPAERWGGKPSGAIGMLRVDASNKFADIVVHAAPNCADPQNACDIALFE